MAKFKTHIMVDGRSLCNAEKNRKDNASVAAAKSMDEATCQRCQKVRKSYVKLRKHPNSRAMTLVTEKFHSKAVTEYIEETVARQIKAALKEVIETKLRALEPWELAELRRWTVA